ncbi:hypothetical protein [Solitalea canadensis]|nr:hypothetical protein [Solitalea canadensis]
MSRTTTIGSINDNRTENKGVGNSVQIMSLKIEKIFVANTNVCATYKTSSVTVHSILDVGIIIKNALCGYKPGATPFAEEILLLKTRIKHKLGLWLSALYPLCDVGQSAAIAFAIHSTDRSQNYATL